MTPNLFTDEFTPEEIDLMFNKIYKDKYLRKCGDLFLLGDELPIEADDYLRKKLTKKEIKHLANIAKKLTKRDFYPGSNLGKRSGVGIFGRSRIRGSH